VTDHAPGAEPLWASFKDVVEQLTGPVTRSTVELVSGEVKRLEQTLAGLKDDLTAATDQQEDAARRLDSKLRALTQENQELRARLVEAKADVAAALEHSQEVQAAWATAVREDMTAVLLAVDRAAQESRSREQALEGMLTERLAQLHASAAADTDALRAHADTMRRQLEEELRASLQAVAARQSSAERLSRATVALLCLALVLGTTVFALR